jgi:hypothetical protein
MKIIKFSKLLSALIFGLGFMSMGVTGDDGGGGGSEDAAKIAADAAAAEAAAKAASDPKKPSDEEARLLKEVMQKKEALKKTESDLSAAKELLKQFDGIDAEAVRKMLADQKSAEEKQLEAKGEWDRLKVRMAEEHSTSTKALTDQIANLQSQLGQSQGAINELSIGTLFGQSEFINSELTLTQSKARVIYGDHFDLIDGKVVAHDKPRGAANRTAIIDQYGNPIGFDDALRKIVEADPEKDHLLKSKIKQGASSTTKPAGKVASQPADADALTKIGAGLKGLNIQVNGSILG